MKNSYLEGRKYIKIYIDNELYLLDYESINSIENYENIFDFNCSNKTNPINNDKIEEKILYFTDDSEDTKKEKTKKLLKRGKKRKDNEKNLTFHDKNSSDNLLRKIQVHYLSFIISYSNDILKSLNYKKKFLKLNYKFKSNINKNFVDSLKKKNIGDIISTEISVKYKNKDKNINKELYEKIKDNDVLNKIFEDNYLKLFRQVYYKSRKKINLKEYGMNKDIILSKNVKMVDDLLKNINDLDENKKIKESIIKNFLPDSIFLLK